MLLIGLLGVAILTKRNRVVWYNITADQDEYITEETKGVGAWSNEKSATISKKLENKNIGWT